MANTKITDLTSGTAAKLDELIINDVTDDSDKKITVQGILDAMTGDATSSSGALSLAANSVDSSELVNGSVDNAHLAGSIAAAKLIGTDIDTVGTITTGTWQGDVVASAFLDAQTMHLDVAQTVASVKTHSSNTILQDSVKALFGTGSDSSLTDNGTSLFLDFDEANAGSREFIIHSDATEILRVDDVGLMIGQTSSFDDFEVTGDVDFHHTAATSDEHALEIDVDAAGFGDIKAVDIDYITGAIAAGEEEDIVLVNIDESITTGGEVAGFEVITTAEGSATIFGLDVGVNVSPIHQHSGAFENPSVALNKAVDVLAAVSSGGAGNITTHVLDNETITIGSLAKFSEIEFILDTGATAGGGIQPTFEFSVGASWTAFTPTDGTNGLRNTGAVLFDPTDIPTWAVDGSDFNIRITRTRNTLPQLPIIDIIQIAPTTIFDWDADGSIDVNGIEFNSLSGTGAVSITNILDEDAMGSDSATALVTQQSIKAYVDAQTHETGIDDIVEDTTPQLGGDLDGNAFDILLDTGDHISFDAAEAQNVKGDAGGLLLTVPSGDTVDIVVNSLSQLEVSETQVDFQSNALIDGTLDLADITVTGSAAEFNTALQSESFSMIATAETRAAVMTFSSAPVFQDNVKVAFGTGSDSTLVDTGALVIFDFDEANVGSRSFDFQSDATSLLKIDDSVITAGVVIDTPDIETATVSARDGSLAQTIADSTGISTFVSGTVLVAPVLGTPASGTMTNVTGTSGITGLGIQSQALDMGDQDINNVDLITSGSTGHVITWDIARDEAVTDNTDIGSLRFRAHEDVGGSAVLGTYAQITCKVLDETTATEDSQIIFQTYQAGTLTDILTLDGTGGSNHISTFGGNLMVKKTGIVPTLRFDRAEVLADGTSLGLFQATGVDDGGSTLTIPGRIHIVQESDAAGAVEGSILFNVQSGGTSDTAFLHCNDAGSGEVGLEVDTNIVATKKLFLDGVAGGAGGDTSIRESAANTIAFEVGGNDRCTISDTFLELTDGTSGFNLGTDGSMEIKRAGSDGFIDFKTTGAEDFDVRVQQASDGLTITTGGNGSTALAITFDSSQNTNLGGNNLINVGDLNLDDATILTIATAIITAVQAYHTVAAETGTTDTLSTINGDTAGDVLVLKADTGDTITVDNADNILLAGGTMALTANDTITLISDGTNWREMARSVNS